MMPEAEIDETTPGELVPINTKKKSSDGISPLAFFLIFIPIIYLGAIATIITFKLIKWGLQQTA